MGKRTTGRVEAKVAIVTGGASGLGLATARRLAEEGARVIISDIDVEQGQALAQSIPGCEFKEHDVSKEQQWISLIDDVLAQYGRLDVLVNNAGIVALMAIDDTTEELWRAVHAVGTDGTFFGCKHGLRAMQKTGKGSIINMSSVAGLIGYPTVFAYAASKGAIRSMTKAVAVQCAQSGSGIRCNSIYPGNMDTPMLQGVKKIAEESNPDAAAAFDQLWMGDPVDVANMVLFLASDESCSVNGAEMVVDNTTTITGGVVPKKA
jgi:3(or 17)beta-hydroxysteroid dehydrogenase